MSLNGSRNRFIDGIQELLWKQWCALGVSGHTDATTNAILDPEALIVLSSWAARYDERLYDLILSWLIVNGNTVNLQRLKALAKKSAFTDSASLRYMASTVAHSGGRKWGALSDVTPSNGEPAPLFLRANGDTASFCPRRDERALHYGFIRTPFTPRNLVVPTNITAPATTLLRLRGLCGISARADILAVLFNGEKRTTTELAAACGYTWKSTNEALQELLSSGLVDEFRLSPRNSSYKLKDAKKISSMLSPQGCTTVNWFSLFEAIGSIWQTIGNPKLDFVSQDTIQGEIDLLVAQIRPSLVLAGFEPPSDEQQLSTFPQRANDKYFN